MALAPPPPVDAYVGQDFYVPAYKVLVRGRELREETYDIVSVSYSENLTAIDSCDLTVNNAWEPDLRAFRYSDGATFLPWSSVELHMGYYRRGADQRRRMLTGEIATMTPNFPESGGPTLTVRALNLLHRFRLKQVTKSFFKKTDTEIAQYLVGRIDEELRKQFPKLKLVIDPMDVTRNKERGERPAEFSVIHNQYPIVFLMERARRIGYELTIKEIPRDSEGRERREGEVVLGFGPSSTVKRPTYSLEWGKSLISIQPTLRVAEQVSKVTVRGWSADSKEPIAKTVARDKLKGEKVVDPRDLDLAEPGLAQEVTVDRPVANAQDAERQAKMILKQLASELVTAKGKTIGLPDLRAGCKLQILGLGRFSARDKVPFLYLVTETTHSFGEGGYTTDFTARMEAGAET